jgi:hypothetical protein
MSYKSNRELRAESLANEQRNYERNRAATEKSIIEVKKTLDHLSREAILQQCATPTRNLVEGPIPPDENTWAWYEKKQCCP